MDHGNDEPSDDDELVDDEPLTRGSPDGGEVSNAIEPGKRSPRWYERIDQITRENRDRSVQNQKLLERVDMRTVWIARLLIGLLVTILGTVIIQTLL